MLTGLLFDSTGDRLTPIHANKKGRRYRYYVSRRLLETNVPDPTAWRLPTHQIENVVISTLAAFLNNKTELMSIIGDQNFAAATLNHSLNCARQLAEMIQQSNSKERRNLIVSYVARISIASDRLVIQIKRDKLLQMLEAAQSYPTIITPNAEFHEISARLTLRRRGVEAKLIVDNSQHNTVVDPLLVSTVANAHTWFKKLVSEQGPSINEIACEHGIPASEISRLLPLAFLAPDIVEAIIDGKQPAELTTKFVTRFRGLPLDWDQQRKALGFPTRATR